MFCAFPSFLVEVQMNAGHIHVTHAKFIVTTWPGLLEAWLVLTSVKYYGNLYILIPLNQPLALTRLRATGPWRLGLQVTRGAHNNFMLMEQEKFKTVPDFLSTAL